MRNNHSRRPPYGAAGRGARDQLDALDLIEAIAKEFGLHNMVDAVMRDRHRIIHTGRHDIVR